MFATIPKQIFWSSVWVNQPMHVRLAWISLLIFADQKGIVYGTVDALALTFGLSPEQMQDALNRFMQPDPNSSTPDADGRRIIQLGPNTYKIVNYENYRRLASKDHKRAYMAEYMRQKRQAQKNITNIQKTQSQGGAQ
jgi:hypothetical protein